MVRPLTALSIASLLVLGAACGDDSPAGEGGGGSGTTGSATASTTGTTTATGSTSSTASGDGGAGGTGGSDGGGSEGGAGGAGGEGAGDACDEPKAFSLADTEGACDELAAELEPDAFHVEWLDVPRDEVFIFENEIAADYAWPYVITFPEELEPQMMLLHERCWQIAGEDEVCVEGAMEPLPTDGTCTELLSPRFGLDPTNYREGENHYRVSFTLVRDCASVTTEFGFTVIYDPQ